MEWKVHKGTHMPFAVVGYLDTGERVTWFECHTEANANQLAKHLNGSPEAHFSNRYAPTQGEQE